MNGKSKTKKKQGNRLLPAINASLLGGTCIYFYGELPETFILLITIFFAFGNDLKNKIVYWFTETVTQRVHLTVLSLLIVVWLVIAFNKIPKKHTVNL